MMRAFTLTLGLCLAALALSTAALAQEHSERARFYLLAGARYSEFSHSEVQLRGQDAKHELLRSGEDGGHIAVGYAPSPSWAFEWRVHYGEGDYSVRVPVSADADAEVCRVDANYRRNGIEFNGFWYPFTNGRSRLRPFVGAGVNHIQLDATGARHRCPGTVTPTEEMLVEELAAGLEYDETHNYGLLHTGLEYYFTRGFAVTAGASYHFSRDDDNPDFWSARLDLKYPF